ncbi:MAG: hypothetical protein ACJ8GW_09435 [Massilia sp.]
MIENIPRERSAYQCDEYFNGHWWQSGHYDEYAQMFMIVPLSEAYESAGLAFFSIGRSGSDGIDFGYRKGLIGIWAFYPIEGDFKFMAPDIHSLVDDWCSGKLFV